MQGILPVKLSGAVAARYKRLLGELLAALGSARCDVADGAVWLRFDWGGSGFLAWGAATIDNDNAAAIKADWLAAALAVDEGNQRGLLGGLLRWVKAQNPPRFPEGADGAVTFKPQTRLSWIAGILPYLGHGDWHVESGYDWNNTLNQATVRRPLPEVVNPALGPAVSSDGYPATHYVGVAGVGKDAAELPADDPRAGMFGYGRQTRQQDFKRGGSNTIAILGVQDHCGPWAQGGLATVRPLTQEPYVNGPDGFGSGQADGMVAGMADGSVRFLSKDISPRVMEQLASVRRGDEVDPAALESKRPEAVKKDPPVPDRKPSLADLHPPAKELKTKEEPSPALRAKLDVPIAKISLAKMPLGEAVQIVATIGNLPVSFDPDAMQELGVSLHNVISLDETAKTTAGKALEAIAASRGMTTLLENGQIVLTSPAEHREILRQIRYTLSDLTGGDAKAAADLAALVQALVAPESWRSGGGQGALEATPDALLITQTGQRPLPGYRLLREAPHRPRVAAQEPLGPQEVRPDHTGHAGQGYSQPHSQRDRKFAGIAGRRARAVQAAAGDRNPHRPPRPGRRRDFRKHVRKGQARQAAAGRGLAAVARAAGACMAGRRRQHPTGHHAQGACRADGAGVLSRGQVAER